MTKSVIPSKQQGLFDENSKLGVGKKKRASLLPTHHSNRDFFAADLFDYALKSDRATMEAPFFSLATKPDMSIFEWSSKDGSKYLRVIPSVLGRATQMDKDALIYIISQIMEAKNIGRVDAENRRVQFTVYNYLVTTNKPTGGAEYTRLEKALERLIGTRIQTNIKTNNQTVKRNFGIFDSWEIIEKSPTDERMIAVEVTLSEWLFNAIQANEVLKLNDNYFRLRKPLERRLYEIGRKHCGQQAEWKISMSLLHEKTGSNASLKEFRRMLRDIINENLDFPDYRLSLDEDKDMVIFRTRDAKKYIQSMLKKGK